jgi:hypothetical protein
MCICRLISPQGVVISREERFQLRKEKKTRLKELKGDMVWHIRDT